MACRSDYMEPTPTERMETNKVNSELKTLADELTHSCDVLREYLLGSNDVPVFKHVNRNYSARVLNLVDKSGGLYVKANAGLLDHVTELNTNYIYVNALLVSGVDITPEIVEVLNKQQIEHREADLKRLMKVFADNLDRVRLRKVLDADATKPLAPQLGFDPDEF